jgi:hypothetical protein
VPSGGTAGHGGDHLVEGVREVVEDAVATALALEACSQVKRVRFYRVTDLVTQLLEAREERQLSRVRGADQ